MGIFRVRRPRRVFVFFRVSSRRYPKKAFYCKHYPVSKHHSCSRCPGFWALDTNISKSHVTMVIDSTSSDLKKWIHRFVSVTNSPSRVGTETRFVWIDCDGVAMLQHWKLLGDIFAQIHLGDESCSNHFGVPMFIPHHTAEVASPSCVSVHGKVQALWKRIGNVTNNVGTMMARSDEKKLHADLPVIPTSKTLKKSLTFFGDKMFNWILGIGIGI